MEFPLPGFVRGYTPYPYKKLIFYTLYTTHDKKMTSPRRLIRFKDLSIDMEKFSIAQETFADRGSEPTDYDSDYESIDSKSKSASSSERSTRKRSSSESETYIRKNETPHYNSPTSSKQLEEKYQWLDTKLDEFCEWENGCQD